MGNKNTKEKMEILNDTKVATSLKQVNEQMSEMTMNMVNENAQASKTGATVKQDLVFKNLMSSGDIVIGAKQKAKIELDVTAMANSTIQSDLVKDITNDMRTKLQEQMSMSQDSANAEGEQFIAELMGAIKDVIPGGKENSEKETSIKNLLDIKSDTELQNIVHEAVSYDLVNKTVQEISTTLLGDQKQKYKNMLSGGNIAISAEQDMVIDAGIEAIQEAGTSNKIMATIANVSEADIAKTIDVKQTSKQKKEGTLQGVSGVVNSVFGGMGKLMGGMFLPLLIIGVVGLFVFYMMYGGDGGDGGDNGYPPPAYGPPPMYGGGLNIIRRIFRRIFRQIYKFIASLGKKNIILFLKIAILILLFHEVYKKKQEHFEKIKTSKVKDLLFSINGKYINAELCLDNDKSKALKFRLYYIDEKYYIFILDAANKEKYLKIDNGILQLVKMSDDEEKYQFDIIHKQNNEYVIQQNDNFIGLQEKCLIVTDKENAIMINIE